MGWTSTSDPLASVRVGQGSSVPNSLPSPFHILFILTIFFPAIVHMYVFMYGWMDVSMDEWNVINVHVCSECMHVCMYVCMYACPYKSLLTCVSCICMYCMYLCMYVERN